MVTTSDVPSREVLTKDDGTRVLSLESLDNSALEKDHRKIADIIMEWAPTPSNLSDRNYHSWERVAKELVCIYESVHKNKGGSK